MIKEGVKNGSMRKAGVWAGILFLILAVATFKISWSYVYYGKYGPGPGLFPLWLSGFFILISLTYIAESIKNEGISIHDLFPRGKKLGYTLRMMGSIILFIILAPYAGYNIASIIMLLILFFGFYKWYMAIGISVFISVFLFYVFEIFLRIPLPMNAFGW